MKFALNDQPIKIDKLDPQVKKVRDDLRKTAIIHFTIEAGNRILDMFDPELLPAFYKPVVTEKDKVRQKQIQIEDLDEHAPMPLLRLVSIKWPVALTNEYVGYRLVIDHGLGDHQFGGKQATSNVVAPEATIKSLRVTCKEGGSTTVKGRMVVVGLSGADQGKIIDFIKLETKLSAEPPQQKQATIDGTKAAFDKDHPGAKAGESVIDGELESGTTRTPPKGSKSSSRAVPPARKTAAKPAPDATAAFLAAQKTGGATGAAAAGKH